MEDSVPSGSVPASEMQPKQRGWNSWGGWGSSAFSVISGIQKAAVDAADELTKSAIAVAKDAAKGVAELQDNVTNSLKPEEEEDSVLSSTGDREPKSPQDKLRATALQKLENASQDTPLSHSMKVIDASVENLATGAWQAFGSAWQGSRNFIQKLEHSAENLAESFQKQGSFTYKAGIIAPALIEGGKALTAKGLEVLEFVGKEAIDLIAAEAGIELEEKAKLSDGDGVDEDERFMDDATFDRCFYIYGGPEQLEELEALSNHHMLLCNRAKSKLPNEEKVSFDSTLKQLQQILDFGMNSPDLVSEIDKGKQLELEVVSDMSEIKMLRETSVAKAAEMAAGFTVALSGLAVTEVIQKTTDRLEAIKVEGVHRLSELCASGISQLLNLGKSLLSSESDEEEKDSLSWPKDCVEKAKLIRAQAQSMTGDIEAISDSFITGIADVTAAFQAALKSNISTKVSEKDDSKCGLMKEIPIEDKARTLTSDLESDGTVAIEKLHSGVRQLIYVVLYTSLKN